MPLGDAVCGGKDGCMATRSKFDKAMDVFRSKETREARAREAKMKAKMEYNRVEKQFQKASTDFSRQIKLFQQMAAQAAEKGQTSLRNENLRYIKKLNAIQIKMDKVVQRFAMMRSMQNIADTMTLFSATCAKIGLDLSETINFSKLLSEQTTIAMAIEKADMLSEQMDEVFDTISQSMGITDDLDMDVEQEEEYDPELDKMMEAINAQLGKVPAGKPASQEQLSADADALRKKLDDMANS